MKKFLALALCFVAALMACNDDDYVYVYETDEAGETVTDTEGNPIIETDEDGEKILVTIDDDDEFDNIADYFDDMLSDEADYDVNNDDED